MFAAPTRFSLIISGEGLKEYLMRLTWYYLASICVIASFLVMSGVAPHGMGFWPFTDITFERQVIAMLYLILAINLCVLARSYPLRQRPK